MPFAPVFRFGFVFVIPVRYGNAKATCFAEKCLGKLSIIFFIVKINFKPMTALQRLNFLYILCLSRSQNVFGVGTIKQRALPRKGSLCLDWQLCD